MTEEFDLLVTEHHRVVLLLSECDIVEIPNGHLRHTLCDQEGESEDRPSSENVVHVSILLSEGQGPQRESEEQPT